ncbi:hypothetical protein TRFO_06652 [Tritrichomonas foetus]|uniref:RRM domain-containing protein n=1 Tax=Tritrichomonas foetus TaxID=1144522 RepID=A0A1J4JWA6_9EUKA|nr:hypothetical protein TRFO_06652 [Tritrichomonas foetus]|eukprot:OHT03425.1 hypothetical protein TRFO_06652 [Tritrichomonas foetus]
MNLLCSKYYTIFNLEEQDCIHLIDVSQSQDLKFLGRWKSFPIFEFNTAITPPQFFDFIHETLKFPINEQDIFQILPYSISQNINRLFFCHIPENLRAQKPFEEFMNCFSDKIKVTETFKYNLFTVNFNDNEAALRTISFMKKLPIGIQVSDDLFDLPIIRFSNLPEKIKEDEFKETFCDGINTYFCQINRVHDRKSHATLLVETVDIAQELLNRYNFSDMYDPRNPIYVNWYVDKETMESIERWKIKIILEEDLEDYKFRQMVEDFGPVFKSSVVFPEEKEDIYGFVTFIHSESAHNLIQSNIFQASYCNTLLTLYNFPPETTEDNVREFLAELNLTISKIEIGNKKMKNDHFPFFNVTFASYEGIDQTIALIDHKPFLLNDRNPMKVYAVVPGYKINITMGKYKEAIRKIHSMNTLLISNIPTGFSANNAMDLCHPYGQINYIGIEKKKDNDTVSLIVTFNDSSNYTRAVNDLHELNYKGNKLLAGKFLGRSGAGTYQAKKTTPLLEPSNINHSTKSHKTSNSGNSVKTLVSIRNDDDEVAGKATIIQSPFNELNSRQEEMESENNGGNCFRNSPKNTTKTNDLQKKFQINIQRTPPNNPLIIQKK